MNKNIFKIDSQREIANIKLNFMQIKVDQQIYVLCKLRWDACHRFYKKYNLLFHTQAKFYLKHF